MPTGAMESHLAAHLPDRPVDAVASSLGARIVLTLAAEEPDRFARAVVAGVGANLFRDDGSDAIARAIEGDAASANPVVQYFAGLAGQPRRRPSRPRGLHPPPAAPASTPPSWAR